MFDLFEYDAFDAADVVDVRNNPLPDLPAEGADESGIARRNFQKLARTFALVAEHAASKQAQLNALEAPPVEFYCVSWCFLDVQCRHGNPE
jgi:hypothetical protein